MLSIVEACDFEALLSNGFSFDALKLLARRFHLDRPDAGREVWKFCLDAFVGARETAEELKDAAWEAGA